MNMRSWASLYGFELKKILKSRLMIAMLVFLFVTIMIEALAPRLTPSRDVAEARRSLSGRVIDDELLQEMYPKLIDDGRTWTDENKEYYGIAYVEDVMVDNEKTLDQYTADEMYAQREAAIDHYMEYDELTEGEIGWWKNKAAKVETPFTYYYYEGALNLAQGLTGILLVIFLISAICVSTVFTSEHRQRTDQVVLSCKHGRMATYFAKIAAGITVVTASSIIGSALLALMIVIFSGMDGLNAVVQLEIPQATYAYTFGHFILIQLVVMITAGILFSTFAMGVSEMLKNSMAVMGLMVGIFIYSQVEIVPPQFRFLSQTRAMLPSNQMSVWALIEYRLINIGGHYITGFVASPILYLIISAILIIIGGIAYNRFQVTGR